MPFPKRNHLDLGRVPWEKVPRAMLLPEMPLPTHEEVIWAAGFWEGEGSLAARTVNANQVDPWPLERLQRVFGGSLNLRKPGRVNQRPCYQWHLSGDAARLFVHLIYPHLSPRRRAQIDEKFITEQKRQRRRASFKNTAQVRALLRGRDDKGRFDHAPIPRTEAAS